MARSPGRLGMRDKLLTESAERRAGRMVEPHRRLRDLLVAGLFPVSRAAMIAHHAQHVLAVLLKPGNGPSFSAISAEVA